MRRDVIAEKIIGDAILYPEKREECMKKGTIHTIVCYRIFCPLCGRVMDSRKASLVTTTFENKETDYGFCGPVCAESMVDQFAKDRRKDVIASGMVSIYHQQKLPVKKVWLKTTVRKNDHGMWGWVVENKAGKTVKSGCSRTIAAASKEIERYRKEENGK